MVIEHMYQRFILECFPTLQVGVVRMSELLVNAAAGLKSAPFKHHKLLVCTKSLRSVLQSAAMETTDEETTDEHYILRKSTLRRKRMVQRRRWKKYIVEKYLLFFVCHCKAISVNSFSGLYDIVRVHVVEFLKPGLVKEEDDSSSPTTSLANEAQDEYNDWQAEQDFMENAPIDEDMFGIPVTPPDADAGRSCPATWAAHAEGRHTGQSGGTYHVVLNRYVLPDGIIRHQDSSATYNASDAANRSALDMQ